MNTTLLMGWFLASNAYANDDLKSLMKTHVNTTNEENVSAVLATLDPNCPDYPQQAAMIPKLFEQYDLTYSLEAFEVFSASEKQATIGFTLCTTKNAGPAYRNNRIQQVVTVNKTESGWKLCAGKVMMIQYLDMEPEHQLFQTAGPKQCQPSLQ